MRYLLYILVLFVSNKALVAQESDDLKCYTENLSNGKISLEANDYKTAINNFMKARICVVKPENDKLDGLIETALNLWTKELDDARIKAEADKNLLKEKADSINSINASLTKQQIELERLYEDLDSIRLNTQIQDSIQNAIDLASQLANFSLKNSIPSEKSFLVTWAYQLYTEHSPQNILPPEIHTAIYDALYANKTDYNKFDNISTYGCTNDLLVLDSFLINICENGRLQIIDLVSKEWKFNAYHNFVNRFASISPDERWLIVGGNSTHTWILDMENGFKMDSVKIHGEKLSWDAEFVNDSIITSFGGDGQIRCYNLYSKRGWDVGEIYPKNSTAKSFITSEEHKLMIFINNGQLQYQTFSKNDNETPIVANLKKIKNLLLEKYKDSSISSIALSKDKRYFLIGMNTGETVFLDLTDENLNPVFSLDHSEKVQQVIIDHQNQLFASISLEGIMLSKIGSRSGKFFIPFYNFWSRKAAFDPAGNKIYMADNKGNLIYWDLDIQKLRNDLCPFVSKDTLQLKLMFDKYIDHKYDNLKPCGLSY